MKKNKNPEAATGQVGDIDVQILNRVYTLDVRLAGKVARYVVEKSGVKGDFLPLDISPDMRSVTIKDTGQVIPLPEEVVEIPTPPWCEYDFNYDEIRHIPGWRAYRSEAMEIIMMWAKSLRL